MNPCHRNTISIMITIIMTVVDCSYFDLNSKLASLNPQTPLNTPSSSSSSTSQPPLVNDFFTHEPLKQGPFTDGSEINPNYTGTGEWDHSNTTFENKTKRGNDGWFPRLVSSSTYHHPSLSSSSSYSTDSTAPSGFMEKSSLINKDIFNPSPNELKLLHMAFNLLNPTHSHPLNILQIGTGSGFIPLALTLFCQSADSITSYDVDTSEAKQNIIRDGKEYFLRKLSLLNSPISTIPSNSTTNNYNLIVLSQSIPSNVPQFIKESISPGGFIIYPNDLRQFKMDRLDENGNLFNIKTIN